MALKVKLTSDGEVFDEADDIRRIIGGRSYSTVGKHSNSIFFREYFDFSWILSIFAHI